MQIGNSLVRIDHREGRAFGIDRFNVCLDRDSLSFWQACDFRVNVADAIVGFHA